MRYLFLSLWIIFTALYPLIPHDYIPYTSHKHTVIVPDDYPTIESAIRYATEGCTILIRPGIYNESIVIKFKHNITIVGMSNVILLGNNVSVGIDIRSSTNIQIRNIRIIGFKEGIRIEESHNITLVNISIVNSTIAGIETVWLNTNIYLEDIELINSCMRISTFTFIRDIVDSTINGKQIVFLSNMDMHNRSVREITSNIGIVILENVSNLQIDNLELHSTYTPILIMYSKNIVIYNNTIAGVDRGISIYNSRNIHIIKTRLINCTRGIWVEFSKQLVVRGSILAGNVYEDIFLGSSSDIVLEDTLINGSLMGGVKIDHSYNIVFNNVSFFNTDIEILFKTFNDTNKVYSTMEIINSRVNGKPFIYIKNTDLGGRGIREQYPIIGKLLLYNVSNAVVDELAIAGTRVPIEIIRSRNIVVHDVKATHSLIGIEVTDSKEIQIEHVKAMNCWRGIAIEYTENINITNSIIENNKDTGINILEHVSKLHIVNNTIAYNGYGVDIGDALYGYIVGNEVYGNDIGIKIWSSCAIISRNYVHDNNIYGFEADGTGSVYVFLNRIEDPVKNATGVYYANVLWFSPPVKYIYMGRMYYGSLGNYWSIHEGVDKDHNGIRDKPFIYNGIIDLYPLSNDPRNYTVLDKIDLLAPYVKIIYPVNGGYVPSKVSIVYSFCGCSFHVVRNTLLVDGVKVKAYSLGNVFLVDMSSFGDGVHSIAVDVTLWSTSYGYISANDSITVFVDSTPPTIHIINPENYSFIYGGVLDIEWEVLDDNLWYVVMYIDGEPVNVTGLKSYSISGLGVGLHNITLQAIDLAGNRGGETLLVIIATRENETLPGNQSVSPTTTVASPPLLPAPQTPLVPVMIIVAIVSSIALVLVVWRLVIPRYRGRKR